MNTQHFIELPGAQLQRRPRCTNPTPAADPSCSHALDVDGLSTDQREALGPALYEIFCESYASLDEETVCEEMVFRPGGRLFLFQDGGGRLVGFATYVMEVHEVDGREVAVLHSGCYFRADVRGGGAAWVKRSVPEVLKARLRNPLRPLFGALEALNPMSYRRAVKGFPGLFPAKGDDTDPWRSAVLNAVIERWGVPRAPHNPFVIRYPDPAAHADPEHIVKQHGDDPDVAYYLTQNLHFAQGDVLCAMAPFGWGDISRLLRNTLSA